jgi:hypothetical protein
MPNRPPSPKPDPHQTKRPEEPENVTAPPEPGIPQPPETLNPEWPFLTRDIDEDKDRK